MNTTEITEILTILETSYPNFYKNTENKINVITLWATMFEKENSKIVTEAVKSLIKTLKFPPTIADVFEKINLITKTESMTELEAWGLVLKAISNSYYKASEEFEKLPDQIQKLIGSPNQLREWGQMESEIVQSVIQSNFMRSYKSRVKQDSEIKALPESAKKMIEQLNNKFEMLDG